jgi:hypothetical protein
MGGELAAKEYFSGGELRSAMEQSEIDAAVRPFDLFLDDEGPAGIQHPPASGGGIFELVEPIDAFHLTHVNGPLIGRLDDNR